MISEMWVFDLSRLPLDQLLTLESVFTWSICDFMNTFGRPVVSGPVNIDWTDRYGWAEMSVAQLMEFNQQLQQYLTACNERLRRLGGD